MEIALSTENVTYEQEDLLIEDAGRLLTALAWEDGELSIVLCDDPFIQNLNRQYRGKDEPTDVLSFAMQEESDHELDVAVNENVLGDVIISLDTAGKQAAALGHTLHTELRVLLAHGILHLLGFDHMEREEAVEMREEEARILGILEPGARSLVERAGE